MRPDRFDALARRAADRATTRRSLLGALGLGGAALALPRGVSAGGPSVPRRGVTGRAQAVPGDVIDELAFELEYDVDRIFAFVRDEVAYDPYPGMLRGAKGTLWGLAGNSVDQATLLSALLDASLVQHRLVAGELPDDAAASLLASATLDAEATRRRNERLLVPPERDEPEAALSAEQEAFVAQLPAFGERFTASVDRYLADGVATVTDGLAAAGVALPPSSPALPERERTGHVWVQYASGPGWVDLDPSMPGAEPGRAYAGDATPLEELAAEVVHRVSFRLVAEQATAGGVARVDLLTYEATSADLVGVPLTLFHPMPEALEQIGVSVGGLLQGFRNFVPTLLVGEETIYGAPVTFGTGEGVLDVFGGEVVEGDTLAEWLEVTVSGPSGATTATRTVFDRVGEEARAAGPVDPTSVPPVDFVAAGDVETNFLPLAGMFAIGVVVGAVAAEVVDYPASEEPAVEDLLHTLQIYHHARDVYANRAPALEGVRLYCDAPNVTAIYQRPLDVTPGEERAAVGIDLLHRSVGAIPASTPTSVHPLVAAGVLGQAIEQSFLEVASLAPLNLPVTAFSGVGPVFAEAKGQGIPIQVVVPGASDGPSLPGAFAGDSTPVGGDVPDLGVGASRLVREALAAGQIVIVPERPVELGGRSRVGWWVVDPTTGATRDAMDDAGGSVASEFAVLSLRIAGCIFMFIGLGMMIYGVSQIAADAIVGGRGGSGKGTVASGIGTTAAAGACAG